MTIALHVNYRGLEPSDALTSRIQGHIDYLESHFPRVGRVNVTVTLLNHHNGNLASYRVAIEADVAGGRLFVDHEPETAQRENAYLALSEAFDAIAQQLRRHEERLRRETKTHEPSLLEGSVIKLFAYEGFGFIGTADGREVYFNENSVLGGGFERLEIGAAVRFCEEMGDKGPQASTVKVRGGHSKVEAPAETAAL